MVTKIEENNDTVSVKLAIYDMEFDITIDKNRIEEYRKVAKEVTNRLNAYTFAFRGRKTEHQIALRAITLEKMDIILILLMANLLNVIKLV